MQGTPVRFDYTGAVQTYTVPSGCIKLIVDCVGARSGQCTNGTYTLPHSKGGRVQCTVSVSSGQLLYIYVGGHGVDYLEIGEYTAGLASGGFNGGGTGGVGFYSQAGGAGGGASDIRIGEDSLSNRIIVAGGAGGCVRYGTYGTALGGAGGGLTGGNGVYNQWGISGTFTAATGGTQTSGGVGASYTYSNPQRGENGSFGTGGNTYQYSGMATGPGGGGGWYGGGGGAIATTTAGGGSSYTDPTLCTDVVHTQGYSEATGNGWIILTPIYPDAYERDPSADKAVIMHSKTYNAFTAAGYDEIGTLHGVYLKNIPDEYGISDAEYITTFEDLVGNTANKAHLMQYIGSKAIVDVPIGKKQG